MYAVAHPNTSDPSPGFITGSDQLRVYQTWKGSNKFCVGGRFIFGPDVRSLALTVFLIVAPMSLFCVFVARELMVDFANNWGISIMVIAAAFTLFDLVLLLLTSGRDPGIIPRNAHPPEPESCDGNSQGVQTPQTRLPRIKEVEVHGTTVKIKYCDTCMLYRPPRCSHCSICNNCVEKFDHHCPWVGQCIGLRNYRFFFMFVFSTTLLCIYVFGFCWVYIKRIMDSEAMSIWKAMIRTPSSIASIVLIAYTFIAVWFVGGLTGFHLYLITTNQTTYENFRYRYDQRLNPYNKGVAENFKEIFCGSMPPSRNKFRDKIARETGLLARPVASSTGFVSPNMGNKGVEDIEMGRKAVASWSELEVPLSDRGDTVELVENKSNSLAETSPASRTMVDESDRIGIQHLRRASWGRKSGSWEMSPEVVANSSSRMGIGSSMRSTDSFSRQNV